MTGSTGMEDDPRWRPGSTGTGVVEFRLLGPLEIDRGGRPVKLRGSKERAVLALLLLRANELVSRDLLIDELWGDRPPASARHTLEAYVSRLRGALSGVGIGALIETGPGGYRVRVDDDDIDVRRFEHLVAEGRAALAAGRPGDAAEKLTTALGLWHGEPFADVPLATFSVEAARLDELRLAAVESRLDAALEVGRHREVVAELESLVTTYPLRERLGAQLMLALYRSGRQADALAAFRDARRRFVDELGIEPSRDLKQLHAAILRQDPALDLAAPKADQAADIAVTTSRGSARRSRTVTAVGVAAAVAVLAAAAAGAVRWGASEAAPRLHANVLGVIDLEANALRAEVRVGARPVDVAASDDAVWVVKTDGTVARLDSTTLRIVRTIAIPNGVPVRVATGSGLVWVSGSEGVVWAIDPTFDEVAATIRVRPAESESQSELPRPEVLEVAGGSVWVGDRFGYLTRIDARARRVVGRVDLDREAAALAFGDGYVWVASRATREILVVDPQAMRVVGTVPLPAPPRAIDFGSGSLWTIDGAGGAVTRVAARSGRFAVIDVGGEPVAVAHAGTSLWVAREPGEVVRIDAASNRVVARLAVGSRLSGIGAGDTAVWVLSTDGGLR